MLAFVSTPVVGLAFGHAVPRNVLTAARQPAASMVETFTSEGAKTQVGNNAFLNEDLMGRAIRGPGVVSKSKLKIGVVGAGLAGMIAAMDLVDAGHEVELFELRPFVGGKVSSWKDNDGNHIEMGLHVFFGCYYNLFGIMKRTGSFDKCARVRVRVGLGLGLGLG